MKFLQRGDKVFQYFIFDNPKYPKVLRDARFSVYDKLERKIKSLLLNELHPEEYIFAERVDSEEKITFVFTTTSDKKFDNYYFTLAGFCSKTAGCLTCIHNKTKTETFIQCDIKDKMFPKPLKNCTTFKEEEGLFKS